MTWARHAVGGVRRGWGSQDSAWVLHWLHRPSSSCQRVGQYRIYVDFIQCMSGWRGPTLVAKRLTRSAARSSAPQVAGVSGSSENSSVLARRASTFISGAPLGKSGRGATTAPLHISHAFPARRPSGEEGPATMRAICLPRSHVGTAMLLCATLAAQAATACERGVRCEPRHCRATSAPHRAVHVSRRPADPHASVRRHAR